MVINLHTAIFSKKRVECENEMRDGILLWFLAKDFLSFDY